jgi:hypothetical protein
MEMNFSFYSAKAFTFTRVVSICLLIMGTNAYQEAAFADNNSYRASDRELVSLEELDRLRGREGDNVISVQSIQDLKATASDNSITARSVMTGPITIEQNAMSNFDGVGLFTIMTGNNNAVSTAVGISIYLSQ